MTSQKDRATYSIATILAVSFGTLVIIAVSLVWLVGLRTTRDNTIALSNDRAVLFVNLIENHITDILDPAHHQVMFFQQQLQRKTVSLDDTQRLSDMMKGALAAAPQITAIIYWDTEFNQSTAYVDVTGRAVFEQTNIKGDLELQQRLEEARTRKKTFWGRPIYAEEDSDTYIDLIQPIFLDGDFKGFFAAIVSISDLSHIIADIGNQFESTAFILYGEDKVLAHPNLQSHRNDLSKDSPMVALDRVGDPVIANFPNREPLQRFGEAREAGVNYVSIENQGIYHATIYAQLTNFGDIPWLIGSHLPLDRTNEEVRRAIRSGIAGFIVLILAVLAAIALGRRLAEPIRRIANSTAEIGTLELSSVSPLPPSRIRELQDQSNAFNSMLNGLKWFETYVPKTLVKKLIAQEDQAHVTSSERQASVLFTDIVGFTSLSEELNPIDVAALLNDHFALLSDCIERENGTIDKFIGDALMAFWNAPEEQKDHADRACRAAMAIADAIGKDNATRRDKGFPAIRVRIGIHTGPIVVGNIGAPGRINYTIVGDVVNAAQRLEALGKEISHDGDTVVLTSAATKTQTQSSAFEFVPLGPYQVKGKQTTLDVFRLTVR